MLYDSVYKLMSLIINTYPRIHIKTTPTHIFEFIMITFVSRDQSYLKNTINIFKMVFWYL